MMSRNTRFMRAARRAVATFLFATIGALLGNQIFNMDIAAWLLVANAGVGAVLNLAYRWAEGVLREPEPVDVPGGHIGDEPNPSEED